MKYLRKIGYHHKTPQGTSTVPNLVNISEAQDVPSQDLLSNESAKLHKCFKRKFNDLKPIKY